MTLFDNLTLSRQALTLLERSGVRLVIICAGARNAPIVKSLDSFKNFEVLYFFDERAAAFFALGRSKATGEPAAVITTSGTAVAELLPAVVEARYSHIPLVVVTADRPKSFRGRGAPQSIEQVGIFSHYIEATHQADWDAHSNFNFTIPRHCPSHLNICFSEPLFATEFSSPVVSSAEFSRVKRPLVILGEILAHHREPVEKFLALLNAPIYAEAHSGLRGSEKLSGLLIKSGDRLVTTQTCQSEFDGILRVGSVPTTRLWRDLEDKLTDWGVLSVSDNPMSGLGRIAQDAISFATFFSELSVGLISRFSSLNFSSVFEKDRQLAQKLEGLLAKHPNSEPAMVRQLSNQLGPNARVFVGNSLPVREWDLAARHEPFEVAGNRGVNGIDGLVSTFLGWAKPGEENVIVLGDLSALYDLSALWADSQQITPPVKIVVINNSGGQIFNRMFRDERFLNQHELEFSKWAEMFGLDYTKISGPLGDWKKLSGKPEKSIVIELQPDNASSEIFWTECEKIFE